MPRNELPVGFCLGMLLGTISLGGSGCGPRVLLDPPPGWPAEWKKRKLFNTPTAFIYAGSAGACGEVDKVALEVARDFKERARVQPTKGLLVVMDAGEEPIIQDTMTLYRLWVQGNQAVEGARELSGEEIEKRWKQEEREQKEHGLSMEEMLRSMPVPVSRERLSTVLGLGPEVSRDVQWAIIVPTRAVVRDNAGKLLKKALEKEKVNLAMRVLMAPFLSFAESKMTDALLMGRDVLLFGQWLGDVPDLSAERKRAILDPYLKERQGKVLGSLEKPAKAREATPAGGSGSGKGP